MSTSRHNGRPQPPIVSPSPLNCGILPQGSIIKLPVQISNPSEQPLLWHVDTSGTRWLILDQKTGVLQPGGQQTVNIAVDTNSLQIGSYAATLTFTSEGEAVSVSVQVPVTLAISPASFLPVTGGQSFAISPLTVGLSFVRNQNSSKTLPLPIATRDSQNTMKWTADTGGTSWLTLDRNEGILQKHEHQTIHVTAYTSSMALGDYLATLTFITDVSGTKSASQLQSELHVSDIPYGDSGPKAPTVTPNHLDFGTSPLVGTNASLNFTNPAQNGAVNWTMGTGGVSWVSLDKSAGTLQAGGQQTIHVTINKTGLNAGNYQTDLELTFTFADPAKAGLEPTSVLIPVTMSVP